MACPVCEAGEMVHGTKSVQRLGTHRKKINNQCVSGRPPWRHSLSKLKLVGTLDLGDMLGSFEVDDVGGLVHVSINTRAKEDVNVGAAIAQVGR